MEFLTDGILALTWQQIARRKVFLLNYGKQKNNTP